MTLSAANEAHSVAGYLQAIHATVWLILPCQLQWSQFATTPLGDPSPHLVARLTLTHRLQLTASHHLL